MITPPFPHDPLSAEERGMADLLGRDTPADGPSAALDARIVSAARAATAPPRDTPRWPAMAGIAATLAIAVGLAWQLRPATQGMDVQDEVPIAAEPAVRPRNSQQVAPVPEQAKGQDAGQAADTAMAEAAPPTAQRPPEPTRETAASSPRDDVVRSRQATPPTSRKRAPTAESVASEPPPAMPGTAVSEPAPMAFPAATPPSPPPADARQSQAASRASGDAMAAQETVAPSAVGSDEAWAEEPEAWLARIRQRRDAGDVSGARESLERFVQAHPDRPLPDDLRRLLDTPTR